MRAPPPEEGPQGLPAQNTGGTTANTQTDQLSQTPANTYFQKQKKKSVGSGPWAVVLRSLI